MQNVCNCDVASLPASCADPWPVEGNILLQTANLLARSPWAYALALNSEYSKVVLNHCGSVPTH